MVHAAKLAALMKKSRLAFRQGLHQGWKLFWSPFVGARDEIRATVNRPRAATWQEFVRNDIRAYFAPLTGAVRGFTRTFREIWKVG
jgi:hypothetical protein